MTQIVVDTDVVSFLFKNHPIGLRYDPELAGRVALISFMTCGRGGAVGDSVPLGRASAPLVAPVSRPVHGGSIQPGPLPQVGRSDGHAQAAGRRIECADAWIAATAMLYGVPLVTHNRSDYPGVSGLTLISHV